MAKKKKAAKKKAAQKIIKEKKKKYKGYVCGNKGYVCSTTFEYEFERTWVLVYPTVEDLKADGDCWKECGIIELEITKKKVISKSQM